MNSRLFLLLTCLLAPALAFPKTSDSIQSSVSIYILGDLSSERIIAEKRASRDFNSASLTKLMTLYVIFDALEDGTINAQTELKISRTAAAAPGVGMFLNEGDIVKIEDLIKAMVIYGASDATLALVEAVAGTKAQFIAAMNQKAKALGLLNSQFTHVAGESAEPQLTSASTLYQLAVAIILNHSSRYSLFKLNQHEWKGITQYSSNSLLGRDPYNDGLIVSTISSEGTIGIISSVRNGRRILLVMGDDSSDGLFASKAQDLINQAFKKFTTIHILDKKIPISQLGVTHGTSEFLDIGSMEKISVTIPRKKKSELEVTIEGIQPLVAPIKYGDVVAKLSVRLKTDTILTSNLVALKEIRQAGIMSRGWRRLKSWLLYSIGFKKNDKPF